MTKASSRNTKKQTNFTIFYTDKDDRVISPLDFTTARIRLGLELTKVLKIPSNILFFGFKFW